MLKSHPNKELFLHLNNTWLLCRKRILKNLKFSLLHSDEINVIIELALKLHDLGKGTLYFQEYINDIEAGIKNPRHRGSPSYKDHGLISGVLAFAVAFEVLKRTEFAFLVFIAVCQHHGNLKNIQEYRTGIDKYKDFLKIQFDSLRKCELNDIIQKLGYGCFNLEKYTLDDFFISLDVISSRKTWLQVKEFLIRDGMSEGFLIINYIFSNLVYADKLEAILHGNDKDIEEHMRISERCSVIPSDIVEKYKQDFLFLNTHNISGFREEAYLEVLSNINKLDLAKNRVLSINLPTGAGKTLAALKTALVIREKIISIEGYVPRIIYALPFTTIIDQNYSVFEKILDKDEGRLLIKHHYLAGKSYKYFNDESSESWNNELEEFDYDIAKHLIESWDSEVVVTTFFQFLHSILSNDNGLLRKFGNIAGSIIILDEVQNIKFEHWTLIKKIFLEMADKMKCIFIFMTATMPLIFSEEKDEIFELAKNKIRYFNSLNRVKIDVSRLKNEGFSLEELLDFLISDIKTKNPESVLIVLNTVKTSIYVYDELKKIFNGEFDCYYLSTNVIPCERKRRIEEIKKDSKVKKLIVSTQVIEAGVDIDVQSVYRDFGPMDCINQTAGRCNRNGMFDACEVIIFRLKDMKNGLNISRDYCSYVYDKKLLEATEAVLKEYDVIEERLLFELSKSYYNELQRIGSHDKGLALIESMNSLEYGKFNMGEGSFRVIDSGYKTVDLFVQSDENAVYIWNKYEDLKLIKNVFERKKAFASMKSKFLDYIISVPESVAKKQVKIEEFGFTLISCGMRDNLYNSETGFIRDVERDYFF